MRTDQLASGLSTLTLTSVLLFGACSLFDKSSNEDSDDSNAGTSGTGAGGTAGVSTGGVSGTGTSGSAGANLGGSSTGGAAGMATGGTGTGGGAGLGTGGAGGSGSMPRPVGDISWDMTGWIAGDMNTFGVQGSWFSYNDCNDAMAQMVPCTMPDALLLGPDGKTGWSTTPTEVCMKGTAAQVMMTPDGGTVDYFGIQWGAGMAFDLNNAGAGAPAMPFNATAAGITGFIFDLIGTAPMTVRINYVMPTTESTAHFVQVNPALDTRVDFLSVNQGSWVTAPVAFDPTQLRTIQFQVFTNDMAPTPYDFCVSNIRVIRAAL